jgi:hypothetical protein
MANFLKYFASKFVLWSLLYIGYFYDVEGAYRVFSFIIWTSAIVCTLALAPPVQVNIAKLEYRTHLVPSAVHLVITALMVLTLAYLDLSLTAVAVVWVTVCSEILRSSVEKIRKSS